KHGPIALLDSDTPVVCIATDQKVVYDKVVSNIQEVRARGAQVIAIATDGNEDIQHHADDVIYVPRTPAFLQAVLAVLPLQLPAYRTARLRGLNVAQPRNLAKTVTVEYRGLPPALLRGGAVARARLDHAALGRAHGERRRRTEVQQLVGERRNATADERADIPDPHVPPVPGDEPGPERACRVHGGPGQRA